MANPLYVTRILTPLLLTLGATGAVFVGIGYGAAEISEQAKARPADFGSISAPAPVRSNIVSQTEKIVQTPQEDTSVLLIGDSHVAQTYGQSLDLLLRARARTDVTTIGSCGSTPDGFMRGAKTKCGLLQIEDNETKFSRTRSMGTPKVDALLAEHQPDVTIIELGANLIWRAKRAPKKTAAQLESLARKVASSSQCMWVGPPNGNPKKKPTKRIDAIYDLLDKHVSPHCTIMDSRATALPFLDYMKLARKAKRRGDGRHFDNIGVIGKQAARKWALTTYERVIPTLEAVERNAKAAAATASPATTRLASAEAF